MFNTFANVFSADEENTKKANGKNPFALPSSTTDPFGISGTMKLSESSEKFDDNPFLIHTTNDKPIRARSGKEALSSSNWLAYQHSMDEANLDPLDYLQDKSLITESNSVNPFNPFETVTMPDINPSNAITFQPSPIDFLFDANVNPNIVPTINSNQSSYDFLGFNPTNTPSTKVVKDDSLTDLSKADSSKTFPSSLPAKSSVPAVDSSHSTSVHTATNASHTESRAITGTNSISAYDDQFFDWLTQTDNPVSNNDPKTNELSKNNDFTTIKNTGDHFGSTYRQSQTLSTLRMFHKSFYFFLNF